MENQSPGEQIVLLIRLVMVTLILIVYIWIVKKYLRYSSDNQLTNRESEILQLIADGKTNKEIANFLQLSRKTVETHRLNIMKKLDVHSGIELIKTALRMGVCTI